MLIFPEHMIITWICFCYLFDLHFSFVLPYLIYRILTLIFSFHYDWNIIGIKVILHDEVSVVAYMVTYILTEFL